MPINSKQIKQLNDEECLNLWLELGSTNKVARFLEKNGKVNSRTGKRFTDMSIWNSAMRHLLKDPDKAYQIYLDHGAEFTREEFDEFLVEKAVTALGQVKSRFMKWAKKHGYHPEYQYIYAERMGLDGS